MNLRERFEQLEPREQKLLTILVGVLAVMLLLLVPVLVGAMVSSRRGDNEELHAAIQAIYEARDRIAAREAERQQMAERYGREAPPLASFVDKIASEVGIEIPESQDRPPVPHGKRFEERSTKLTLQRVGLLNLVTFLERIENAGYPVRIANLNLRKRPTDPDSYDVNLVVSAYDRKEVKAAPAEAKASSEEAEGAEGESEEEVE